MDKLEEVVLEHFSHCPDGSDSVPGPSSSKQLDANTRVMIFAQYRDSVQEITDMLNRHWPNIRCMSFIGQASAGKNTKGFTQKEQIRVVGEFRSGGYNTLVSTCVGEEGLDIGDVDLIVCYDAHQSPIRLVQRMGRTGRKRKGRIIMLVTEGKEEAIYNRSQYSKRGIHRALQSNSKSLQLYPCSPRMIPRGLNPLPHKMNIKVGEYLSKQKAKKPAKSAVSKRRTSLGGDISKFMRGVTTDTEEDVFLTPEELSFWNLHYKVDRPEVLKPPPRQSFLSLNKHKEDVEQTSTEGHLFLTAFPVWQTNKQPTHRVSHSRRTNNFVEIMEFIDMQGQMEDEDLYGTEMALYLDEGDVLKAQSNTKQGILKYCSQEKKTTMDDVDIVEYEQEKADGKERSISSKGHKKRKHEGGKSEDRTCVSDDELPFIALNEDSARPDLHADAKVKSKKTQQRQKSSTNIHNEAQNATKSKKSEKIPNRGSKNNKKSPRIQSLPKFSASDEEDFDCGVDKAHVPVQEQPDVPAAVRTASRPEKDHLKDDQNAVDEPMDTASDDDLVELSKTPDGAALNSTLQDQRTYSRNHPSTNHNLSLNTSDIFLSCSQVSKNPDVSARPEIKNPTSHSTEVGILARGDEMMPPPPPSLSGLDLLDDIDLSFSATQLTKTNSIQKSPSSKDKSFAPSNQNCRQGNDVDLGCNAANSKATSSSFDHEIPAEVEGDMGKDEFAMSGDDFEDVEWDEEQKHHKDTEDIGKVEQSDVKLGAVKQSETMTDVERNEPSLSSPQTRSNDAGNLTHQLVNAWDNFDGDLLNDDILDVSPQTTPPTTKVCLKSGEQKEITNKGMKDDLCTKELNFLRPNITPRKKCSKASDAISLFPKLSSEIRPPPSSKVNFRVPSDTNLKPSESPSDTKGMKQEAPMKQYSRHRLDEHENVNNHELEQPHFDLDFDFGDFFDMDDEAFDKIDVVPPSPQVSQSKNRLALSQTSQLTARTQTNLRRVNVAVPPYQRGLAVRNRETDGLERDYSIASANAADNEKQQHQSDLNPSASFKHHDTEDDTSRWNLQTTAVSPGPDRLCDSQRILEFEDLSPEKSMQAKASLIHTGPRDPFTSNPQACSTPVSPVRCLGRSNLLPAFHSSTRESDQPREQDETPTSKWQTKPKGSLHNRLSTAKRGQLRLPMHMPSQDEEEPVSKLASMSIKRKSSSPSAGGQLVDDCVSNPMKKHKTSNQNSPCDSHDSQKDDLDSLFSDVDWDESLKAERTLKEDGKKSGATGHVAFETEDHCTDESDDDILQVGRRTRKSRVLMSPDSLSTVQTPVGAKADVTSASPSKADEHDDELDDDFSFIVRPKKRRQRKLLDTSSMLIPPEDSDNDFMVPHTEVPARSHEKVPGGKSLMDVPLRQRLNMRDKEKSKKRHRGRRHAVAHFLDEEAEVSEDEQCSSDEDVDSASEDSLDGFINNATQLSQESSTQDMHAIYLKSVRSPVGRRARKVAQHSPDLNIFSQVPQQDATYMEDSFVVQGDEEERGGRSGSDEDGEVSCVAMENTICLDNIIDEGRGRPTRARRMLRSRAGESRAARILRAGRAAVLKSDSSASESGADSEDDDLLNWDEDFEDCRKSKHKKQSSAALPKKSHHPNRNSYVANLKEQSTCFASNQSSGWLSKPTQRSTDQSHNHQPEVSMKAPQSTNCASNSSGEGSLAKEKLEMGQKPFAFVVPELSSRHRGSEAEDSQTLARREKEERLKRQQQKQSEFLKRMQEKRSLSISRQTSGSTQERKPVSNLLAASSNTSTTNFPNSVGCEVKNTSQQGSSSKFNTKGQVSFGHETDRSFSVTLNDSCVTHKADFSLDGRGVTNQTLMRKTSLTSPHMNGAVKSKAFASPGKSPSPHCQNPLVILVDSKELASAPHMVSTLTITHQLNPVVSQLQGCDYVTSTRMGVEKRTCSEFENGANRQKLLDRVRHMCELFDRPCLIIEKDRVRGQDKKQPKTTPRTKYIDATLAALSKTHVKILFSESTEETAQILSDLVHAESRKGMSIPAVLDMDPTTEHVFKFYQSIPGVSFVTALTLIHQFPSIQQLVSSCESILQSRIKVSSMRARQIMAYLSHRFDEQMTGSR